MSCWWLNPIFAGDMLLLAWSEPFEQPAHIGPITRNAAAVQKNLVVFIV